MLIAQAFGNLFEEITFSCKLRNWKKEIGFENGWTFG